MAIISDLSILYAFLIVLPESLDATSTFVLISQVVAEGTLNTTRHVVPIAISHCLEGKKLSSG